MERRRDVLKGIGIAGIAGIAGCAGGSGGDGADGGDGSDGADGGSDTTTTPSGDGSDGDDSSTDADGGSSPESVTFRGSFSRIGMAFAHFDAGVQTGQWEETGLNVEYQPSGGSQQAASSVLSGNDQFGNGSSLALLRILQSGPHIRILGQEQEVLWAVVSLADTGISDWSDLEGLTVGSFPYSDGMVYGEIAMRNNGVDPNDVNLQNVQPGSGEELLMTGDIDAMIKFWPPSVARLQNEGYETNVLRLSEELNITGQVIYAKSDFVENNPDTVSNFVRGWLKSHRLLANSPDTVIEEFKPLSVVPFNEEVERDTLPGFYEVKVQEQSIAGENGKGYIPEEKMQRTVSTLSDAGAIGGIENVGELYTNEYIEQNQDLAIETAQAYYDAQERVS